MPASRNPFYIRTAEQAESDDQFLSLFSMAILDLLPEDGSWNRFLPIEAAPGSGKSTLLRLFTPTVLTSIANSRNRPEYRDLVKKLTEIDAIDPTGVNVLGVLVNCKEDYSRLADIPMAAQEHNALFRILLHSRLALLILRAALQLVGLDYPSDVGSVQFEPRSDVYLRRPDPRHIGGGELFEQARSIEAKIITSLNSFVPRPASLQDISMVDDVFQLLNSHHIVIEGHDRSIHPLIMFDDAHQLEGSQRTLLISELERHDQSSFASWMAMRLRALEPPDLVSEAARPNREQLDPVRLDGWGHAKVEGWLLDVGNRRAQRAERDVSSFAACLAETIEPYFSSTQLAETAEMERARAYDLARPYDSLYRNWLASSDSDVKKLLPYQRAIRWSQLQILMERRIRKLQSEFIFESLSPSEVGKAESDTLEAATMFMSSRHDLPYFYGIHRVIQLASMNVDQFLSISASLFDLLLNTGNLSLRHHRPLTPSDQHRLILNESRKYMESMRTNLPYGQDVFNLIMAMGSMCRDESLQPNLPITPGVTGMSIQISERNELIVAAQSSDGRAMRLLGALASAVAHNVLSVRLTKRLRDEDRVVFYLNRLICPALDLPLGFGGYKPQRISRLFEWVESGLASRQQQFNIGRPA